MKSLGDPYSPHSDLRHGAGCSCESCTPAGTAHSDIAQASTREDIVDRAVENTLVRALFGGNDISRRRFMAAVGRGTAMAALASAFPMGALKSALADDLGPLEQTEMTIPFLPITCATPIIMGDAMGFYERYGLNVTLERVAGWPVVRDRMDAGEFNAAHMLAPMPLSIRMGVGASRLPVTMPAVENINGNAITLANKHKDKMDPKDWKGFTFAIPFDFSMHNFLLRYLLAEHGLDPDRDVSLRVMPPPEMVANLQAENIDGYIVAEPFNQRAVWEGAGFIHTQTKDIWSGHPCCAFVVREDWVDEHPNTFGALFRAIVDATQFSSEADNRKEIAEAISPRQYLNQPVPVMEQILVGRYADGLGEVKDMPDRIDFDPFPWQSMAVWMLTQMKRWGYIDGDVNYHQIAEEVFQATECRKVMEELGYNAPEENYRIHEIMGKEFDPHDPEGYLESFEVRA